MEERALLVQFGSLRLFPAESKGKGRVVCVWVAGDVLPLLLIKSQALTSEAPCEVGWLGSCCLRIAGLVCGWCFGKERAVCCFPTGLQMCTAWWTVIRSYVSSPALSPRVVPVQISTIAAGDSYGKTWAFPYPAFVFFALKSGNASSVLQRDNDGKWGKGRRRVLEASLLCLSNVHVL